MIKQIKEGQYKLCIKCQCYFIFLILGNCWKKLVLMFMFRRMCLVSVNWVHFKVVSLQCLPSQCWRYNDNCSICHQYSLSQLQLVGYSCVCVCVCVCVWCVRACVPYVRACVRACVRGVCVCACRVCVFAFFLISDSGDLTGIKWEERETVSGKVHKAGFELETPKVQLRYMLACCPRGCRARLFLNGC